MNIAVTTLGCDAGRSGIGRYASTLLQQWIALGQDLTVFGHPSERAAFWPAEAPRVWHPVSDRWQSPLASVAWHQACLPRAVRRADVLFLPAGNRRLPIFPSIPCVATVHDCSSLHVEAKYDPAREFYIRRVLPWLMDRADHIITVSESTRRDLVQVHRLPAAKVTVIPLAADSAVFHPRDAAAARAHLRARYGLDAPYLLYTSRIEHPGKNHLRLLRAFELLKSRQHIPHDLVFVGPERERAEIVRDAARRSPFASSIRFLGHVPGDDLPLFYSAADMLVFPSLYEGFGLPLVEAMACGLPVTCSDVSSLPEVVGDCAPRFNPYSSQDIADAIALLLDEDPLQRQQRVAAGLRQAARFSWQRTALATLDVLRRVANPSLAAAPQLSSSESPRHAAVGQAR